jgi:aminoglycoside phosphotransferase (APT) family kinase protein
VYQYLPGVTLAERAPAMTTGEWSEAGEQLGGFLAQLTRHTFDRRGNLVAPPLRVEPWPWAGRDLLGFIRQCLFEGPAGERLGAAARDLVWSRSGEESQRWASTASVHLAHGDFGPTNLLSDGGRLTGVVDWEFAHAGDLYMDLGNVLRPRDGYAPPAEFATAIEQGLRAAGVDLPDDWRARAAFVDLASALEFLGSPDERPATHAAAREQIIRWLDQNHRP